MCCLMRCTETSTPPSEFYDNRFLFDLQLFADDGGEKTEEPTAKKKSDARNKGQVAKSQELNAAFVLFIGFWAMKILGSTIYREIAEYTAYIFGHLNTTVDTETVLRIFLGIVMILLKTAFPIMVAIMLIGLAINLVQVGWNFTTEPLGFDLDKLNPINGFGRIFSKRSLVELIKSLFKILIIGLFLYENLKDEILQMPKLLYLELGASMATIADIIFMMAFKICAIFFALAILDYMYQKWDHNEQLKMTKQEVKEEFKQMEGDPQIKGKIKQKQREMAMSRMMREVPKADVIVTNPTHFAVALRYAEGMRAPEVIAKGQDYVALKIKDVAREAGVVIVENKPLARALFASVEIGETVPPELYKAVAEVLAYVYHLKHPYRYAG
ncbi:MAG: flagellar biosynthesis protein FlhB [Schwartzia sp.]|nr:flagellar biosynthesis protein FlhB [Schwartzia sp. (in: firmicutes)]